MKTQQLLLLFLASICVCEASHAFGMESWRVLTGSNSSNSTGTKQHHTNSSKTKSKHTNGTTSLTDDFLDDDDTSVVTGSLPVASFDQDASAQDDDDDKDKADSKTPEHHQFTMEEKSNSTVLFTPPEEVEPFFWKPFVTGFFVLGAAIFCLLTAQKACCSRSEYQEIPSTTLVV